jgi:hypothetical protein
MTTDQNNKLSITTLIAILAFILSLWNTWSQYQNQETKQYEDNAYRYHPELYVNNVKVQLSFKPDTMLIQYRDSIPRIVLRMKYDTAHAKILFENKGNAHAKLLGFGFCDSNSTMAVLRNIPLASDTNAEITEWKQYYSEFSIPKSSNDSVNIVMFVSKDPGGSGIFHFILFYENQRGNLFDTYCWMPYSIQPSSDSILVKRDSIFRKGGIIIYSESESNITNRLIKIHDRRNNPKSYSLEEAANFRQVMKIK